MKNLFYLSLLAMAFGLVSACQKAVIETGSGITPVAYQIPDTGMYFFDKGKITLNSSYKVIYTAPEDRIAMRIHSHNINIFVSKKGSNWDIFTINIDRRSDGGPSEQFAVSHQVSADNVFYASAQALKIKEYKNASTGNFLIADFACTMSDYSTPKVTINASAIFDLQLNKK